jgi:hypothetical protein
MWSFSIFGVSTGKEMTDLFFELLTNGDVVRLPGEVSVMNLPERGRPHVVLLAQYNRVLVGTDQFESFERWLWGKPDGSEWEEISLYEGMSKKLHVPFLGDVHIKSSVVTLLRRELLNRLSPPGNHDAAAALVRDALQEDSTCVLAPLLKDEETFREMVEEDVILRAAYWGFRMGLLWGGPEMILRIKMWVRLARLSFDSALRFPRMWFFLTGQPDETSVTDLLGIGFSGEQLRSLDGEDGNPVLLKGPGGYLIQAWHNGLGRSGKEEHVPLRVWLYLTVSMWDDLRGKKGLSLREMVFAAWGFLEATDAWERMRIYGGTSLVTGLSPV